MADDTSSIDPTKSYGDADLAAMRQVIAAEEERQRQAVQQRRNNYARALAEKVTRTAAYTQVRSALDDFAGSVEIDDNLHFHVEAVRAALRRIDEDPTLLAVAE